MGTYRNSFFPDRFFCLALVLLALMTGAVDAYQVPAPFWASRIDSALSERDRFFKKILQDTLNFSIAGLNKIQQSELCAQLADNPETANPWYYFSMGILECKKDTAGPSGNFATALALSQQDPGATWALFVEFTRNQKTTWAER